MLKTRKKSLLFFQWSNNQTDLLFSKWKENEICWTLETARHFTNIQQFHFLKCICVRIISGRIPEKVVILLGWGDMGVRGETLCIYYPF